MTISFDLPVVLAQSYLGQHVQFFSQAYPERFQTVLSDLVVQKYARERGMVPATDQIMGIQDRNREEEKTHSKRVPPVKKRQTPQKQEESPRDGEKIVDIKV